MIETTRIPEIDFGSLQGIAGEDGLTRDPQQLEAVVVDDIKPQAIVRPETNEHAAAFLKFAYDNNLKVAIRGGGTKSNLGNPIAGLDLILSTERMNAVLEYSPADLMIGVQAGANLQEIQNQLELNGQTLPIDAPLSGRATIGGTIAANSSGPARLQFGPARDWLIGVRYILPEGLIAHAGGKVVKNVAGYDMMKILLGSLGTLALITEMNFKLLPLPNTASTLVAAFGETRTACEVALKIIEAGLFPNALTVVNSQAAKTLGLDAPENAVLLLAEFRNTKQAVERQLRDSEMLGKLHNSLSSERVDEWADQKKLWRTISDAAYTRARGEQTLVLKAGILPADTAALLELAQTTAAETGLELAIISQAGHGITYFSANYEDEAAAAQFVKIIAGKAEAGQGSIALESAPLTLKHKVGDVWGNALSEGEIKLMRAIKAKLDPKSVLNPGRFVAKI